MSWVSIANLLRPEGFPEGTDAERPHIVWGCMKCSCTFVTFYESFDAIPPVADRGETKIHCKYCHAYKAVPLGTKRRPE